MGKLRGHLMIAHYLNIAATIERLVLDGWKVVTPSANHGVSIRGTFSRATDSFDPAKHRIVATATPGVLLRRGISQKAQVQKVKTGTPPAPTPLELTNWNNGDGNDTLTPGGLHTLNGDLLKYDQSDPEQGIFIIPLNGGGLPDPDQAVRVEIVNRNTPQEISFLVPAGLAPGEYTLEVRSTMGQNTLCTGKYSKTVNRRLTGLPISEYTASGHKVTFYEIRIHADDTDFYLYLYNPCLSVRMRPCPISSLSKCYFATVLSLTNAIVTTQSPNGWCSGRFYRPFAVSARFLRRTI